MTYHDDIDPYDDPRVSDERYYAEDPAVAEQERQQLIRDAEIAIAVDEHQMAFMESAEQAAMLDEWCERCRTSRNHAVRNAPILTQGCKTTEEAAGRMVRAIEVRHGVSRFGQYETNTKALEKALGWLLP